MSESNSWDRRDFGLIGVAIIILVVFRFAAFAAPLEIDECNYAYFGQQLLAGDQLYVDLWDHQPPGMFMLTTVLAATFGTGPMACRWLATVAAAATMVFLYAACRRHLNRGSCWLVAALYAVVSSDPGVAGEGCNREIYMNLLAVAAFYFLLKSQAWKYLLGAGLLLGISSLVKTVVAAQWLAIALAVAVIGFKQSPLVAVRRVLLFGAGPAIVWVATFLYFHSQNRLSEFIDAAFIYNLDYGKIEMSLWEKFAGFFGANSWTVFRSAIFLWLAGGVGLILLPWRRNQAFAAVTAALAVGSFVAVCLPGKFWHHYYMLMLPVLVVGAVTILDRLACLDSRGGGEGTIRQRVYSIALVVMVFSLQFVFYLSQEPDDIATHRYGGRMAWARDHGFRVASVTDPDDYIYVCGIDSGIYYYGQRRCATRYPLATMLTAKDEKAAERRKGFLEDLKKNKPRLILIVKGTDFIPELNQFITQEKYQLAGQDPGRMDVLCSPNRPVQRIEWDHMKTLANGK